MNKHLAVFAAALLTLAGASTARADEFNPEKRVSGETGTAKDPSFVIDVVGNVLIAFVEESEVTFAIGPILSGQVLVLTDNGLDHSAPVVQVSPLARITVAYEEEDTSAGAEGPEIQYLTTALGVTTGPFNLSSSLAIDRSPRFAANNVFVRTVLWVEDDSVIRISDNLGEPVDLVDGHSPSSVGLPLGGVVLVYVRDGDLYAMRDGGSGFEDETPVAEGTIKNPCVAVGNDGQVHICYEAGGDVYYVTDDDLGGYTTPVNVSHNAPSSTSPRIAVSPDSEEAIVLYLEGGDVRLASVIDGEADAAVNVTGSSGAETNAGLAFDSHGFIHLVYQRAGEVYYRNDAPPPEIVVETSVTDGEVPLEVRFDHVGTGAVTAQLWDFGDGTTSGLKDPVHTYIDVGSYDVTLTLYGPGGVETEVFKDLVEVIPVQSIFEIPKIITFQGEPNVVLPLFATHILGAQGYQVAAAYDGTAIEITELSHDFTQVDALDPEFVVPDIVDDGVDSYFTIGVVFDILDPFDGRVLAVGTGQRLVHIHLNVKFLAAAPQTTVIDLRNDIGDPEIQNILTVDDDGFARTVLPALIDGEIVINPFTFPPPRVFLRGDVTGDGSVSLNDGVKLLNYLFLGGTTPTCLDAGDVNDNGAISLPDPIRLLQYLFLNGVAPSYPFPGFGLDPTTDGLGNC